MAWRLTWESHSWGEDDVTVADAVIVSELLERDDWRVMEPTASPRACVAWLSVLLARTAGVSIEEAQAAVMARPFRFLVDALTFGADPPADPPADPSAGVREPLAPVPSAPAVSAAA